MHQCQMTATRRYKGCPTNCGKMLKMSALSTRVRPGYTQVFIVVILLCPATLGQSSTPVGQWVGSFDVDGRRVSLSGNINRQDNEFSLSAQVIPGAGNVKLDCTVRGERIRFAVPWKSGQLSFQGELRNGSIEGTVVGAKPQGKFTLLRTTIYACFALERV